MVLSKRGAKCFWTCRIFFLTRQDSESINGRFQSLLLGIAPVETRVTQEAIDEMVYGLEALGTWRRLPALSIWASSSRWIPTENLYNLAALVVSMGRGVTSNLLY